MRRSSSLHLPLDIIYLVIDFIDQPYVLSRLALTSKSLYRFITSNHLYFRYIRFQPGQSKIWSLFQTNVQIASQIRMLHLFPYESYMPPLCHALVTDNPAGPKETVVLIKNSLTNMINLTGLMWLNLAPRGMTDITGEEVLEVCLDILYCKDVWDLFVSPVQITAMMNPSLHRAQIPPRNNSTDHLARINFCFANFYLSHTELEMTKAKNAKNAKTLIEIITNRCPRLEDLSLSTFESHIDGSFPLLLIPRIFIDGRWPNLRRLAIIGFISCLPEDADSAAKSAILNTFWARHPNIECLLFRVNDFKLDIQQGLLPKLKSLSGFMRPESWAVATDVLVRVKHLCDMTISYRGPSFPISYFQHATSLKSLIVLIVDEHWEELLLNHPTITHFATRKASNSPDPSTPDGYSFKQHHSVLKTLSSLPHLTHLYFCVSSDSDPKIPSSPIDASDFPILSRFPKLKYVTGSQSCPFWDALERDAEGRVIGWHLAREPFSESSDGFDDDWGCKFNAIMAQR